MRTGTDFSSPEIFKDYEYDEPGFLRKIVYHSRIGSIGKFRCQPTHERFSNTGPTRGALIVFPRTSVQIQHPDSPPIHADSNVVMFYNPHQHYLRAQISDRGDLCDVFRFDENVVRSAVQRFEPSVVEHPERPFKMTHGPSIAATYLFQRAIFQYAQQDHADPMLVDESLLRLLERTTSAAYRHWFGKAEPQVSSATLRDHEETVKHTQLILSRDFHRKLSIESIADEVLSSPFHLCRLFRKHTGHTIHQYLTQLRLRNALDHLEAGENNLMQLAAAVGLLQSQSLLRRVQEAFWFYANGNQTQERDTNVAKRAGFGSD